MGSGSVNWSFTSYPSLDFQELKFLTKQGWVKCEFAAYNYNIAFVPFFIVHVIIYQIQRLRPFLILIYTNFWYNFSNTSSALKSCNR